MRTSARNVCLTGLILLVFLAGVLPAFAWRINKELEYEIEQKRKIVKESPNDPNARFDLAITYAYTNHIEDGWAELKKVNEMDPSFKEKALKIYNRKVTAQPNDWKLRFRLAFALYFNQYKADAIRELKNVLIIDPYNVWAYGYISLIYGEMDDVDQAIEYAKKGLKIDDRVAALHMLLSQGYYKKGDNWNGFWEATTALRLKALGY